MDKATQLRIFDPYFTTKNPGDGTGLGLAMVDGIVKKHHGFIRTYSEINRGSTFQVFWPVIGNNSSNNIQGNKKNIQKPLTGPGLSALIREILDLCDTD